MILIDKEIKRRHDEIFIENYNEKMVQSISYDLTLDQIITSNEQVEEYKLKPYEFVQIKCLEKVHIPNDLIGRVVDKNSRIRQGITITSPVYQPGHETYIFFRIQNISMNVIEIKKGDSIAQIMFEQLSDIPETTYANKIDASFNDEATYRGLGKYQSEYEKRTEKYIEVK